MVPEFRLIEIYRPVVLVKAYQKATEFNGELKETVPDEGNGEVEAIEAGGQPNDTSSEPLMQLP